MMFSKKPLRLGCLAIACLVPTLVPTLGLAQWQWTEKDGRKVFSDRAPPPDIAEENIVLQPGGARQRTVSSSAPSPGTASPGVDPALEEQKNRAEAALASQKRAEEAKRATARAENCTRARIGKNTLSSGLRIAHTDAQGERSIMDDQARAAEIQRINAVLAAECP